MAAGITSQDGVYKVAMALSKPEAAPLAEIVKAVAKKQAGRRARSVLVWGGPKDETPSGKENAMPIYVTLLHYTERGVHHVKDTVKREEAFKTRAKKHGVTFKEAIWTLGAHDGVLVFEAPDDETATAVILSAEELGNVRTETMRGFTAAEMEKLLAKVD